jgi:hypothetical protein
MYFVPEGQHDSSQARSAWVPIQKDPVPEGGAMNRGSRIADCGLRIWFWQRITDWFFQSGRFPSGSIAWKFHEGLGS